jgi:hypothetical protein
VPIANTYQTYEAKGQREDLTDIIRDISPTSCPFQMAAGGGEMKAVLHEWQMDVLRAAQNNPREAGEDANFTARAPTTRVGNFSQIVREEFLISGTLEAVDKAGRNSEIAREATKLGKELKRDREKVLLDNQGGVGHSAGVAGRLAGLPAWIKTNTDFGAGGADPVWTAGVPAAGRTDGTQRAFQEGFLTSVVREAFTAGAEPTVLSVGPFNKQVVSTFAGIAPARYNITEPVNVAIVAAADIYKHDYGKLTVVPNRFQRERDAFLIDYDLVSVRDLRGWQMEPLSKTGDADKRMVLWEGTLRVEQEAGLAIVADLTTA